MRRLLVLLLPLLFALPARGQTVTAPAGTYSITVPAPVVITYGAGSVTFTWGGPAPQPTPPVPTPPPAPPTPPPVPILTGEAWAMIVYEGTIPPVAISRAVRDYAANLMINVDPVTPDIPRASGYLDQARKIGLPAVVFVQTRPDGTGEAKHFARLPADEASFVSLMKQLRGKM